MNLETFEKANVISNKIKELEENLFHLKFLVRKREQHLEEHKTGRRRWVPFVNLFCLGTVKDNTVTCDVPIEGTERLEFELDRECIDIIIKHEEEKIAKLKREFEEL